MSTEHDNEIVTLFYKHTQVCLYIVDPLKTVTSVKLPVFSGQMLHIYVEYKQMLHIYVEYKQKLHIYVEYNHTIWTNVIKRSDFFIQAREAAVTEWEAQALRKPHVQDLRFVG